MSMDPNNPYAASPTPYTSPYPSGPHQEMDYIAAIKAPFSGDGGIVSLLLGGVCLLLGCFIVPMMVFLGYAYECAENLIVSGRTRYVQFDTNRLGKYLSRGWVPWLMLLLYGIAAQCINYVVQFGVMGVMAVGGGRNGDEASLVAALVSFPISLVLNFLFYFVMTPASLQAGLTQDINKAFDFGWIFDFAGKMWKELALSYVVMLGVAIVGYLAGLAMLCVGIIPALAYILIVGIILQSQMYSIYLSRGGKPLQFKHDDTPMPMYGPGPTPPSDANPFR